MQSLFHQLNNSDFRWSILGRKGDATGVDVAAVEWRIQLLLPVVPN